MASRLRTCCEQGKRMSIEHSSFIGKLQICLLHLSYLTGDYRRLNDWYAARDQFGKNIMMKSASARTDKYPRQVFMIIKAIIIAASKYTPFFFVRAPRKLLSGLDFGGIMATITQ